MNRHLLPLLNLILLLLGGLACRSQEMRARDLPVWECPTATPRPTDEFPSGWQLETPPPATYTPYPTPTPYLLATDFYLGRHVRVGDVGGVGLGVWVWLEQVQVAGPFSLAARGGQATRWVARWQVTVENGSLSQAYAFYPFAQLMVVEVVDAEGRAVSGAWPVSGEAHAAVGLTIPELEEERARLAPGERVTVEVAAFIPGPQVTRLGYLFDPLAPRLAEGVIGDNLAVWLNAEDPAGCPGEVTVAAPPPGGVPTQPAPELGYLLARHPVSAVTITRGFGCSPWFTGELGASCPAAAPWFHNGVDYAGPEGAAYLDALAVPGEVFYAGVDTSGPNCAALAGSQPPHRGYGNYVRQRASVAGHTLDIWGAHLSSLGVQAGEASAPGQALGRLGSTGCSTGTHLHFAVRVDGLYVDPLTLIP